jgi:DNA topoisomerase IA
VFLSNFVTARPLAVTIPNFTLHKKHLMSICIEKEHAFNAGWNELKEKGYLKVYRIPKDKKGLFLSSQTLSAYAGYRRFPGRL